MESGPLPKLLNMNTELKPATPQTLEELKSAIINRYDSMSKRLRLVGDFFVQNPNTVALENLVVIAGEIDVSPSTLVRFANFFGFAGFSELQQLYRSQLKGQVSGYRERVRHASEMTGAIKEGHHLLDAFSGPQSLAIDSLSVDISPADFDKALDLMSNARIIYVTGARRAFPVAYYLCYALMRADLDVILLDGVGAMHKNQLKRLTENDLLLAVSYHPHADETNECIQIAHERHCPSLVLTDHSIHPCKEVITHGLQVKEAEMMGMRSLSTSMHLAQCLVMGLLCRQEDQVSG